MSDVAAGDTQGDQERADRAARLRLLIQPQVENGQVQGLSDGEGDGPPSCGRPPGGDGSPSPGDAPEAPGLPEIQCNERQMREITDDAVRVILAANDPPQVFERGGILARLRTDRTTGCPSLETVTPDALRGVLARVADWIEIHEVQGDVVTRPRNPPMDIVRDLVSLPCWPFPLIDSVIETPVFDRTGRLVATPGFHPDARLWYHQPADLVIPPIPENPTTAETRQARELLLGELFHDFPFAGAKGGAMGQASRAHALVALLLPFVRQMIDGPTRLHLVTAPAPGTGKGLLIASIGLVPTGREPDVMAEFQGEEEAQKVITSVLAGAPTYVLLDNLSRVLDSASLAALLTARTWTGRVLGHSRMATFPVTCCFLGSGNNPRLSKELVRRAILIRLDAKVAHPEERKGFRHPLPGWARQNRGQLVCAALTLVRAWIAAGKPAGKEVLGSYECWCEILGGILDVAEVPGFLGDRAELRQTVTDLDSEWQAFVVHWWTKFADRATGVRDLHEIAAAANLLDRVLGDKNEPSQRTKLGLALSQKRDAIIGGYRIVDAEEDHSKLQLYRLEPVPANPQAIAQPSPTYPVPDEEGEWSA